MCICLSVLVYGSLSLSLVGYAGYVGARLKAQCPVPRRSVSVWMILPSAMAVAIVTLEVARGRLLLF